jgi:hypothetical protein
MRCHRREIGQIIYFQYFLYSLGMGDEDGDVHLPYFYFWEVMKDIKINYLKEIVHDSSISTLQTSFVVSFND